MKEQFQKNREELIGHIEAKLAMLKEQRDLLLNQSNHSKMPEKIKISNYLQSQENVNKFEHPKIDRTKITQRIPLQPQPIVQSKKEIVESRQDAKQKCQILKDLYERKRQLQSIGVYEGNPSKIKKIYQSEVNVNKIKKEAEKNKKKLEQQHEKQKIIQQQLTKVQAFLKESKKESKTKTMTSKYAYSQLLKDQKYKLNRYQQLLNKNKLTLVDKDDLLKQTFDLIKQFPERISKKILQEYLLANDKFCKIFYLTKEEIMRDLQVHKTKDQPFLDYQQYYEFIKSVEITNKALKPNLNFKPKESKVSSQNKEQSKKSQKYDNQKQIESYLKKIFLYLDQKHEKIVERQRIQIALSKCLLFDQKKMKNLNKEILIKFGQFIKSRRIPQEQRNYYKKLDLKYIGMDELFELYRSYSKQSQKQPQQPPSQKSSRKEVIVDEQPEDMLSDNQKQTITEQKFIQQEEQTNLQQDFQIYGWQKNTNEKQHFSQLRQLDHYYKQMKDKYGNQIHWNNYKVYQQDFQRFNEAISKMKNNQSNSKEIIGINIHFPVKQEDEEQNDDQQ